MNYFIILKIFILFVLENIYLLFYCQFGYIIVLDCYIIMFILYFLEINIVVLFYIKYVVILNNLICIY